MLRATWRRCGVQHTTGHTAAFASSASSAPLPSAAPLLRGAINDGRAELAAQFATMDGWQATHDERFDAYVKEQRLRQRYDAFDQRVERAYAAAARAHKAEVINAYKRRLTASSTKYTAQTALDLQAALQERLRWLREVWSQVDADYRSGDAARQAVAAREMSAALQGEPGEYMQWVYERQRTLRLSAGPKTQALADAEVADAELPDVSDEEVSRYHGLRLSMADVERRVKTRYGLAGQQHWAELQAAKDAVYAEKLSSAAAVYEQLVAQHARYEESQRTAQLRQTVARVHEAQVRFKAAMALESERERAMEAHAALSRQRKQAAREARIAALREAAELRARGATSAEVRAAAAQRRIDAQARQQAEAALREREHVVQRKHHYLDLIERLRSEAEWRDGREMMAAQADGGSGDGERMPTPARARDTATSLPRRAAAATRTADEDAECNVYGFADADALDTTARATSGVTRRSSSSTQLSPPSPSPSPAADARGEALWAALRRDKYEDPAQTVHQARLDAAHTYDPLYERFSPFTLAQGRQARQNAGEHAGGNESDHQVLKRPYQIMEPYFWGVQPGAVHDLDGEGSKDYLMQTAWHVRDKTTGDIDWRYERRKGGAAFTGPRFYRLGAEREARDPGLQTTEPLPYTRHTRSQFAAAATTTTQRRQRQQQGRGERAHAPWQPPRATAASSTDTSVSWRSE